MSRCRQVVYILLAGCGLLLHAGAQAGSVSADEVTSPSVQHWYACPQGEKRAVYVTQPVDVRCQPAKQPPQANELTSIHADNEDLQRLWYAREFATEQDVTVLSKLPSSVINVHLRQPPQPKVASTAIKHTVPAAVPVRKITPPKQLTPRQLILRDISREQRALNAARQQWQQAKKQGSAAKLTQWQQNISDHQASILALKRELSHY